MKKIIVTLLIIIGMFGCGKDDNLEKLEFRKLIIYTINGDKPYTGLGAFYYEKNIKSSEGYSKNGMKDGEWSHYYYNGQLKKKGNYINGKEDGEWVYYYHSGELEGKVRYKNGKEIRNKK
ncbi:MAG: hypothetical protein KAH04_00460 [Psychrilyobacter sp.]|nr:hypothetical protein [Psychrilyobacter sp.]